MLIRIANPKGLAPSVNPAVLAENMAQSAADCLLGKGTIRPLQAVTNVAVPTKVGTVKSIFPYAAKWFNWLEDVDVCRSPIAQDAWDRVYFTGGAAFKPQMTANDIATGGADYPTVSYDLGIPAPTAAPALALQGAPQVLTAGGDITLLTLSGSLVTAVSPGHGIAPGATYAITPHNTGIASLDGADLDATGVDADTFTLEIADLIRQAITAISKANPAQVTSAGHGLQTGDTVALSANGMSELQGWTGPVTVLDADNFTLDGVDSTSYGTFTSGEFRLIERSCSPQVTTVDAITHADPAQATAPGHGLATGDRALFDVTGMTELDGEAAFVTVLDADNFTLDGVDSRYYGAFAAGSFTRQAGWLPVDTAVDQTLLEDRAYVYTFVSAYGEEGPPSPPSPLVTWSPGQTVAVSGMATAPAGNHNITQKRIYRTNTGSSGTDYQLVATIAVALTTYTDAVASAALGSVLASTTWDAPPEDLHSLIALPCGALAGLAGNELCFSEPYLPHAWPPEYRLSFDLDGVALGAFGSNILVATDGVPYVVAGSHPENMTPERLEEGYACVSKRGLVDMGYAVVYPAANGLMLVGLGQIRLLTEGLIDATDWQALAPETIHACMWDKKYVAFWSNGTGTAGFVFDPATGDLVYHSIPATGGYHDPLTGKLYLVSAGQIATWNTGASLTAGWKSKRFKLSYPACCSCAQVAADAYPVTVKVYADGVLKHTQSVADARPFRLPTGFRADDYEIEVSGAVEVTMLAMATSMQELGSV